LTPLLDYASIVKNKIPSSQAKITRISREIIATKAGKGREKRFYTNKMATSKKQAQKRGRPAIIQEVMDFIEDRIYADMAQPEQSRVGVLAYQIREALKEAKKKHKKWKIPAASTIEKIISKITKEPNAQEQPWDMLKLRDNEHPIPSEAIPMILRLWVAKREQLGRYLTVREARWAGRLYALAKDISLNRLAYIVQRCANTERSLEGTRSPKIKKLPLMSDYSLELSIFELITGQKIDSKRAAKILGHRELDSQFLGQMFFGPNWTPSDKLPELVGEREFLRDIGGKNE
jgi:hypothetical protein